jgi:hypothetical protein
MILTVTSNYLTSGYNTGYKAVRCKQEAPDHPCRLQAFQPIAGQYAGYNVGHSLVMQPILYPAAVV